MPQYNRRELDARAREYGFNRDTFEKLSDTLFGMIFWRRKVADD
jgi:hypothetical protein